MIEFAWLEQTVMDQISSFLHRKIATLIMMSTKDFSVKI